MSLIRWLIIAAGAGMLPHPSVLQHPDPPSLSVKTDSGWVEWWRADRAPARWSGAHAMVAGALSWTRAAEGIEWGELTLSGAGEAWRTRVIVVRIDPQLVTFDLARGAGASGRRGVWRIDSASPDAVVAFNAGQFSSLGPWGWVVRKEVEERAPGIGPLSAAFVVDTAGRVTLVSSDSINRVRSQRSTRDAFQSYPTILSAGGVIPSALRHAGSGVDLDHRDARLALGMTRDRRLLVALTRFEGLGGVLSNLPFGLTTPETAALMGALGAERAMLLDGGISSQLLIRPASAAPLTWNGLRPVPLGLIVRPRASSTSGGRRR